MSDTVVRFRRTDLGELTKIGSGGQGTVFDAPRLRVNHAAAAVYKEYHPEVLAGMDLAQLEAMVGFAAALPPDDQAQLFRLCAWPMALITDDEGTVTGIAMPRVPEQFFVTLRLSAGPKKTLAQFQHLLNTEDWLGRRGLALSDRMRLQLVAAAADGLQFLHSHGITVGDLSAKNLLFSFGSEPTCYFIDCDAMGLDGRSVMQQLETPDWDIRTVSQEPLATIHSDTYKLALATLRLFAMDQTVRNPRHAGGMPAPVRDLIITALDADPTQRPALGSWLPAITGALQWASTKLPATLYEWRPSPESQTTAPASTAQPAARAPYNWSHSQPAPGSGAGSGSGSGSSSASASAPTSASAQAIAAITGSGRPAPTLVGQLTAVLAWWGLAFGGVGGFSMLLATASFEQADQYEPYGAAAALMLRIVVPLFLLVVGTSFATDVARKLMGRQPHAGEIAPWQWATAGGTFAATFALMYISRAVSLPGFRWETISSRLAPIPAMWTSVLVPPVLAYVVTLFMRLREP